MTTPYTVVLTLTFRATDVDLASDFAESPVLLPSDEVIKKMYEDTFGLVLEKIDYTVNEAPPPWPWPTHLTSPIPIPPGSVPPPATKPAHGGGKYTIRSPGSPCTDAQVELLLKLHMERAGADPLGAPMFDAMLKECKGGTPVDKVMTRITKGEASHFIDRWMKLPYKKKFGGTNPTSAEIPPGFYRARSSGDYYQVKETKDKSHVYALKLTLQPDGTTYKYLYAPGYIHNMVRDGYDPVTSVSIKAFADLTTCCVFCGRRLEDALSVARGVGPKCYARHIKK